MDINFATIKNMLEQAEKLKQLVEEAKEFVLAVDVDHMTIQDYQKGFKYLVDILNVFHKQVD